MSAKEQLARELVSFDSAFAELLLEMACLKNELDSLSGLLGSIEKLQERGPATLLPGFRHS